MSKSREACDSLDSKDFKKIQILAPKQPAVAGAGCDRGAGYLYVGVAQNLQLLLLLISPGEFVP